MKLPSMSEFEALLDSAEHLTCFKEDNSSDDVIDLVFSGVLVDNT